MWENENKYRKYACLCLPILIHILSLCDVNNRDENLSVWISSLQRAGRRRGEVTIPLPPFPTPSPHSISFVKFSKFDQDTKV